MMCSWFLGVDLINQICKTVTPRVFPCDPIAARDFFPRISVDYPVGVQEGMDVGRLHGKTFPIMNEGRNEMTRTWWNTRL